MRSRPWARRSASTRYTPGASTSTSSSRPTPPAISRPSRSRRSLASVRGAGPQRARAGGRLGAHRQVVGLEAEPARRGERVDRDVAAPGAQRRVDLLAVVLELAGGRPLAQHVGADEAKRAVVGHQPQRHHGTDALAELVGVEPADGHHAAPAAELVPRLQVALRAGASSARPGATRKRSISGTLRTDSPVSVTKLHSSMPSSASQSSASNGMPGPARLKRSEPCEKGWAAKPKPPAARTAGRCRPRRARSGRSPRRGRRRGSGCAARRHLLADQQQHVAVPALLAVALGRERVVVGEEHDVRPGAARRPWRSAGTVPVPSE